jgi:hypothetical protein
MQSFGSPGWEGTARTEREIEEPGRPDMGEVVLERMMRNP